MNGGDPYLSPRLLQVVGIILLVGSAVFWAVSGRESVLLMSASMSLIGLGAYRGVTQALRDEISNKRTGK